MISDVIYYLYKVVVGSNSYISGDCSIRDNFDGYKILDDLYCNGSSSKYISLDTHLFNRKNFLEGFRKLKGSYKTRLDNNVFIAEFKSVVRIKDKLIYYNDICWWKKEELVNNFIVSSMDNVEWKAYENKDVRRQKRLAQDGNGVLVG